METVESPLPSNSLQTARDKRWPYEEYYLGDKDSEGRKNGQGENHWTGAESIEWYTGTMVRDMMHGEGDYRWRYKDPDGTFVTYEGQFFANRLHGYGVMSYPDGRRFTGLFFNDVRWGPGEERSIGLHSNVGLWRGTKLARLCWRPNAVSIAPDLANGPSGAAYLDPFRLLLMKHTKIIGETNPAIDLLKQYGDPVRASKMWPKLYSKYCTDIDSALCHKDIFDQQYYKGPVHTLGEVNNENKDNVKKILYFAWNNSPLMLHMMKHSYQHDQQRGRVRLNLGRVLNGSRKKFRPAAKQEYDCRCLLMASYLGRISNVVRLVNEEDIFPDVADSLGNTALMYSVVGDQLELIHFLIEAGASVNSYNDSCCTPLGVALMRYLCTSRGIPPLYMPQVLLPLKSEHPPRVENQPNEWYILRKEFQKAMEDNVAVKADVSKPSEAKDEKELPDNRDYESDDELFSEEREKFLQINGEYISAMNILFATKSANYYTVKIFTVKDMLEEIAETEYEMLKRGQSEKARLMPKQVESKYAPGLSRKSMMIDFIPEMESTHSMENEKTEVLSVILSTISQLLKYGADPKLVKVPQPAILMATKSGRTDLLQLMVSHGVDVNERFPDFLDYTALDVVIAEPFTDKNLKIIRTLLKAGAETSHRLKTGHLSTLFDQKAVQPLADTADGPTLLHIVIARQAESENEEEIQREIIALLLKYHADPTIQYNGRSPIEYAMIKNLDILKIFTRSSSIDLNCIINKQQHTMLVKLFSREYFSNILGFRKLAMLTNLLLLGADPFIECYDGSVRYENMFEFAKKTLNDIAPPPPPPQPEIISTKVSGKGKRQENNKTKKPEKKDKKKETTKKEDPLAIEYAETLSMMRECSRLLYVRWLQAQLLKELIDVIHRFNHRHWTMIIKEHKNGHNIGLWMTPLRCLEIWDILESTNKKKYKDESILCKLLCIVQFYHRRVTAQRAVTAPITAVEKDIIQKDVRLLMREHKMASELTKGIWRRPCVKPELAFKAEHKFQICFECGLRLREDKITCEFCGLVSFCNLNCMSTNSHRGVTVHPCCELLIEKYLPPAEDLEDLVV